MVVVLELSRSNRHLFNRFNQLLFFQDLSLIQHFLLWWAILVTVHILRYYCLVKSLGVRRVLLIGILRSNILFPWCILCPLILITRTRAWLLHIWLGNARIVKVKVIVVNIAILMNIISSFTMIIARSGNIVSSRIEGFLALIPIRDLTIVVVSVMEMLISLSILHFIKSKAILWTWTILVWV